MKPGVRRIHFTVICGLLLSAVVFGFLSVSVDIKVPQPKDHPYKSAQVDGCYQIFDRAYLDRPGCYVLRNDVFVESGSEGFLYLDSDNIDLDLNGNSVTGGGATSTQAGIYVAGGNGVTIRNGSIKDFMFGIRGETGPNGRALENITVQNIVVYDPSIIGIKLDAADVRLVNVNVNSDKAAADARGRQYLFDISVDATRCFYSRMGSRLHQKFTKSLPKIRLPDNCLTDH